MSITYPLPDRLRRMSKRRQKLAITRYYDDELIQIVRERLVVSARVSKVIIGRRGVGPFIKCAIQPHPPAGNMIITAML